MALEASHIRVALAVKDKLKVNDLGAFLRGTIYPDSRYMTNIDRLLTHPTDYRTNSVFMQDDFFKGWFVHLLCDGIQYQVTKETLPSVCEGKEGQGSDVWVRRTAIKIIQDMSDVRHFDIVSVLPHFTRTFAPNGENVKLLENYHQLFVNLYQNPEKISLEETYGSLWSAFGLDTATKTRLLQQTQVYMNDQEIRSKAEGLYEIIVQRIELELLKL